MCVRARIAIFRAFAGRTRDKNRLTQLITANNLFSMKLVASIRQSYQGVFVNAHGIEDVAAEFMERWQEKIAGRNFRPEEFEAALAEEIHSKNLIVLTGQPVGKGEIGDLIRNTRMMGGKTIGQVVQAWAAETEFHAPTSLSTQDVVSISDDARGELDALALVNGQATGNDDPDLCG